MRKSLSDGLSLFSDTSTPADIDPFPPNLQGFKAGRQLLKQYLEVRIDVSFLLRPLTLGNRLFGSRDGCSLISYEESSQFNAPRRRRDRPQEEKSQRKE